MNASRFALGALFITFLTTVGCELFSNVDRQKIPQGTGGAAGAGGSSASSMGGGSTECSDASECDPPKNECVAATCDGGKCGTKPVAKGMPAAQKTGNCKKEQCDGQGNVEGVVDDGDLPHDGKACTDDVCDHGKPSNPNTAEGEACGSGGMLRCDGMGHCVACTQASDCGTDDACKTFTCTDGTCDEHDQPAGHPTPMQTDGDCKVRQCDGAGSTVQVSDNSDLPDDGMECTDDLCSAGMPSHPPSAAGTACGTPPEQCDGAGQCVACLAPADCPGVDDACQTRTCDAGVCGFDFQPDGTAVGVQTPGDCKTRVCDGMGTIVVRDDDLDVPNDSNPCTTDLCNAGVPSHGNAPSGTTCAAGLTCDGNGNCNGCTQASQCPGTDDDCKTRTCTSNTCNFSFTAAGTATTTTPAQVSGDCKQSQCDGNGNVQLVALDTDLPADDGNECTDQTCAAGSPQHPPSSAGTSCTSGGTVCDGASNCVACNAASDCPGVDTDCRIRSCSNHACGFTNRPTGTPTSNQTLHDCRQNQCDGMGGVVSVPDNADVPLDDGNACTDDVCNAGAPSHPNRPNGTSCDDGTLCTTNDQCTNGTCGGTAVTCTASDQCHVVGTCNPANGQCSNPAKMDGSACSDGDACTGPDVCTAGACQAGTPTTCTPLDACHVAGTCDSGTGACSNPVAALGTPCPAGFCNATGTCVACNVPTDCPGTDTECQTRTCMANTCAFAFQMAGTPVSTQTSGDCHHNECDGMGNVASVVTNADVPVDGQQCTQDLCTAGVPSNPALPTTATCNQNGGTHCDGVGNCVQCNTVADCGTSTECRQYSCTAGVCSHVDAGAGTVLTSQTAGDCHQGQCDGAGNIVSVVDNSDLPVDGNECTQDLCTAGVPSNPPLAVGTACTIGGRVCSAAGVCTRLFDVVRVGDGSAALDTSATRVFLEQRFLSDGTLNPIGSNPLAMPTVVSGANARFMLQGSAMQEGQLAISTNSSYVVLAGYDAVLGAGGVGGTTSAAVNRVVARVDAARNVDTSTRINALCSTDNARSAATGSGNNMWVGCSGSGVVSVPFGTTGGTQIETTVTNVRGVNIFGGDLFASSASASAPRVFQIGSGLPTTAGQTTTAFPGIGSGGNPGGFRLFDLTTPTGADRLYLADSSAIASGGGIQRWNFDGTTWSLSATFTSVTLPAGPPATCAFAEVAATQVGGVTAIVATTVPSGTCPGYLTVSFQDTGASIPTGVQLSVAPTNTAYRGVAFSAQ